MLIVVMQELSEKVSGYHELYEVQDTKEWNSVITELKAFSTINCAIRIANDDGKVFDVAHRCTKVRMLINSCTFCAKHN